ncbi:MAG: DNA polymerase Y family protein [Frankiaceae bacterium]|nr:DNA polymerase Y family protein [Frankiaceae bacterium]
MSRTPRLLTLWCPDWPVVALDLDPDEPAAVLVGEDVFACSHAARAEGVRRGLRRREAQRRCPDIRIVERDEAAEVRAFEPVVNALEAVCPTVEVTRPGLCALPTKGPARYFGGDEALVHVVAEATHDAYRIGIADGRFASAQAARRGIVVPQGKSAAFLAPLPVDLLDRPALVDLFARLGLRTLGDIAALPSRQVASRFGAEGIAAHRLARGLDEHLVASRTTAREIVAEETLDPPVESVEQLAFVAKRLADTLAAELAAHVLGCARVLIEAETDSGEKRSRLWRYDGAFTAAAMAQRVRWQVAGWLEGPAAERPSTGVTKLRLTPDEVHRGAGQQLRLFDDATGSVEADERAATVMARLQGLLGFDAVNLAVLSGGRGPAEWARLVPWGEPRSAPYDATPPWPGRLPAPRPTVVHDPVLPARVVDGDGADVLLDEHGAISVAPQRLSVRGGRPVPIAAWAGPWPVQERWWDAAAHVSLARFQIVTADGVARLVATGEGRWWVEGTYD